MQNIINEQKITSHLRQCREHPLISKVVLPPHCEFW